MMGVVEEGYDLIAEGYLATKDDATLIFAKELEAQLKSGMKILDAGCGAGIPIAKYLSSKFEVFGIDISAKQIELAKKYVPNGVFKKADFLESGFENEFFDGLICLYALIHVDRKRHLEILKEFYKVLKSPGYMMICMGLQDWEGEEEYHGTTMYWSHFGREKNLELLKEAGFEILWEKAWNPETDPNDRHLFVLCRK